MEPQLITHKTWGYGYLFQFPYTKQDAVAHTIASFFEREGYDLEEGNSKNGIYGVGSADKRLLVGSFSKRYLFKFIILEKDGLTLFEIYKAMSGFSGGVLGKLALDKEWERILTEVKLLRPTSMQPAQTQVAAPTPPSQSPVIDIPEQIEKLSKLKEQGILTEDEFQSKKQELLSRL